MHLNSDTSISWLGRAILLALIIGLLAEIAIPNVIGGGGNKLTVILNVLRRVDTAKSYWAGEHGYTNAPNMAGSYTARHCSVMCPLD